MVARFDGRNPRAEGWLRGHSSQLVTEIIDDQRVGIRDALRAGMEAGQNPRTTALEIVGRVNRRTRRREGGLIGLTSAQMGWVRNARDELENNPAQYLERMDGKAPGAATIRRRLASGKPLNAAEIRATVERYEARLLKYRGDVIGRTETLTALNAAKHESLLQLVDSGKVQAGQITRVWDATGDGRTRDSHRLMEGQSVGLNEPFTTPTGFKMMYPGDTSMGAPAGETIQCRCVTTVRINYLAGVR